MALRFLPALVLVPLLFLPALASLRQLHLVFRHGQRTPADTYPKDPYINDTFSPFGWGQLTNEGKRQQYEQGQFLRGRYDEFLGDKFNTYEVESRTTGVDRTKMSMMLMMAGLWPPKGDQVWNKELLWQPVPYSSQELSKDTLLLVRSCPRYAETLEEVMGLDDIKAKLEEQKEFYSYLKEHTGKEVANPDDVQDIYSTLKAEKEFGLELPEWTKTVYPERLSEVTTYSFILNAYNNDLQKIKAGPLVKKILSDSKSMAEGKTKKKLFAYAGHDSTISNLMLGLKIWDPQVPVYNIMTLIEVHETNGIFGMKFFLRNTTEHEPYELKLPGCNTPCPLEEVEKLVAPIMPEEHSIMCKAKDHTYIPAAEGGP